MSVITKTGYIDFYNPEYLTFHATQYDDGTRSITLTPKNGSEMLIFEPSKWDASVIYCKSDNNVCMDNAIINNDYSITFTLSEQMLAVRGRSVAQFCLTRKSDGKTIRSTAFYVIVNESTGIEQLESTSEFNTLNILIKKINNAYVQTESIIAKTEEIEELYNQAVSANTQADAALEIAEEAVKVAAQVSSDAKESANKALSYQSNALKYSQNAAASATEAKNAAEQVASTDIGKVVSGETAVGNSKSLGGETSAQWQSKLNNIQTTSRATLSTAGWYRVAELKTAVLDYLVGNESNTCDLIIKRQFYTKNNEYHYLRLRSTFKNQEIVSMDSKSNVQLFTKARYTYTSNVAYFEVYYSETTRNDVRFIVNDGSNAYTQWQAITPTLTSEEVDGVTVTTTYDIPANASPVTDLDIAKAMEAYIYPLYMVNTEAELTALYDTLHNSVTDGYSYKVRLGISFQAAILGGGAYILEGFRSNASYGWQRVTTYFDSENYTLIGTFEHSYYNGAWTRWQRVATVNHLTTALAGYLPKTGGKLTNNLEIASTIAEMRRLIFSNSAGIGWLGVDEDGYIRLVNTKANHKEVLTSTADGTNTFNGHSTEDLPLSGGRIKGTLQVEAPTSDNSYIIYHGTSGKLGHLGFSGVNNPVMVNADATVLYKLLHTGNSNPTVQSTTAPSDTTAIWIDTANKKLKAYIDGAWTVIA